jgi:hypothetical protein
LTRWREPFDHPEWIFEIKYDGFRALAHVEDGAARLVSRTGHVYKAFTPLCAEIVAKVRARTALLDGEVVCLDERGTPDFYALLYRRRPPCFYAFDLIFLEGEDLREKPLLARKRLLRRVLSRGRGPVGYVNHVRSRGVELFSKVCAHDLEGVVAKLARSPYRAGRRAFAVAESEEPRVLAGARGGSSSPIAAESADRRIDRRVTLADHAAAGTSFAKTFTKCPGFWAARIGGVSRMREKFLGASAT